MKLRNISNIIIVFFLASFAVLSVYGAFLGAARAKAFFNVLPMAIFWCLLLVFFVAGFTIYPSLKKRYSLALIHLGCTVVLVGGIYGSKQGHEVVHHLFDRPAFTEAAIQLHPGQSSNVVSTPAGEAIKLPFTILLVDAFIDYYDKPAIRLYRNQKPLVDVAPEVDKPVHLPNSLGTVQVLKAFRNLKLKSQDDRMVPYDAEDEPGSNRAWELVVSEHGGETVTLYAFERFAMHSMGSRRYVAEYRQPQMVKDYKSILQILDGQQRVRASMIEVNKPLYYDGYHFYQNTFGYDQSGPVSGIRVASAQGVWMVFAGYGLIFAGLAGQCWGKLYRYLCPTDGMREQKSKDLSGGVNGY